MGSFPWLGCLALAAFLAGSASARLADDSARGSSLESWAFNCGSGTSLEGSDGLTYSDDVPFDGVAGFVGGIADTLKDTDYLYVSTGQFADKPLYLNMRSGAFSYQFTTQPGPHELIMHFVEGVLNGPTQRTIQVGVGADVVVLDLDLYGVAGKAQCFVVRRVVEVPDSLLVVNFSDPLGVGAVLSAIAVTPVPDPRPRLGKVSEAEVFPSYEGGLLTWRSPADVRFDGYVVRTLDSRGAVIASEHRYLPFARVAPGDTLRHEVCAMDAWGLAGDAVELAGVEARSMEDSPYRMMKLSIEEADLRRLESDPAIITPQTDPKIRVPATLDVDGITRVGRVNYRGNSTLRTPKKSYKFRIDEGPPIDGSNLVNLSSNFTDASLVRELAACHAMEEIGLKPYGFVTTRLFLNDVYAGLYFKIEEPDEDYLERIGRASNDRCYKVNHGMGPWDLRRLYRANMENSNAVDYYRNDIIEFSEGIMYVSDVDREQFLREYLDLDDFMDWYAAMAFTANQDCGHHNYMLNRALGGTQWSTLPWDVEAIFYDKNAPANYGSLDAPYFSKKDEYNEIVEAVCSVPSLFRRYLTHLQNLLDGPLDSESIESQAELFALEMQGDARLDVHKRTHERLDLHAMNVKKALDRIGQREVVLEESIAELMPPLWVDLAINELDLESPEVIELHYRGTDVVAFEGSIVGSFGAGLEVLALIDTQVEPDEFFTVALSPADSALTWIGLQVFSDTAEVMADSIDLAPFSGAPVVGRWPDGFGKARVLRSATPGELNDWEPPAVVEVEAFDDQGTRGERIEVGIRVTSLWREQMELGLHIRVERPGGINFSQEPVNVLWVSPLAAGEEWTTRMRVTVPRPQGTFPAGQWDLVVEAVEGQDEIVGRGRTTIFITDSPRPGFSINEFVASNGGSFTDEAGESDDWMEIVCSGDSTRSLDGFYLTDDLNDEPLKWAFGPMLVHPGERKIIWLDGDLEQGPLHASFKLDRDGEEIALVQVVGTDTLVVDHVEFGYQYRDWSCGRYPDAQPSLQVFSTSTPDAENRDPFLD